MALQLAWDVASQGIPTLFLSLEMYEEDIIERLFCLVEKVDNYDLLTGKFKQYEEKWQSFRRKVADCSLVITDMLGKTWQQVDEFLASIKTKPRVVFIDHLQEARSDDTRNQKDTIETYLKNMRIMAIRDNFALVICSQVNRASQEEKTGAEPQLHNLKSSGYIEEGADVILLLHWPWHYSQKGEKERFIVNVAKNRNGRTGWASIKYKPENYWFYEEETHEEVINELNQTTPKGQRPLYARGCTPD